MYGPTRTKKLDPPGFIPMLALVLLLLLSLGEGKQTVLMSSLTTKNDRILLGILKETNFLLSSRVVIKGRKFECLSIVKNELTRNVPSTYLHLNYSLSYLDVLMAESSFLLGVPREDPALLLNYRLERILSGLAGICVYFRTNTFLTEYCHKEHVRQYDDEYTKAMNQKKEYEDFNLGEFTVERLLDRGTKPKEQPNKKPDLPPEPSDFSHKYKHFLVEATPHHDFLEVEEDPNQQVLHSNAPIVHDTTYLETKPTFVEVTCQDPSSGQTVLNYAWVVHPYSAVYTKKNGSCGAGGQLRVIRPDVGYTHFQEVRVLGAFMFGKVEEVCTKKWNWSRKGRAFSLVRLQAGSVLFIQFFNAFSNRIQKQLVTVKKVYHPELIELQQNLGYSIILKSKLHFPIPESPYQNITQLNRCELFFQHPLNYQHRAEHNKYLNPHLMILDPKLLGPADNRLGCYCELQTGQQTVNYVDMEVTVGAHLWLNYYQVYVATNSKIYREEQFKNTMFRDCYKIVCYRHSTLPPPGDKSMKSAPPEGKPTKPFTTLVEVDQERAVYNVSGEHADNVYVVSIFKGGVLRMVTEDRAGVRYVYLLSEGQLLKVREFANGSKEVEKENKFYENSTGSHDQSIYNMLYIYCFHLPNGSFFGAIWKHRQYVQFPRIKFTGEKILYFQHSSGYACLRKLDLTRMQHPDMVSVTHYLSIMQEQYQWERLEEYYRTRNIEQQYNSMFLNDSYAINFTYTGGDFCGPPFNKNRETSVTMKCGTPWYQITEVRETSPCSYWLQIETLFLCHENLREVVENEGQIPNKTEIDKMIFSGVVCMGEEAQDEVHALLYPGKELLSN